MTRNAALEGKAGCSIPLLTLEGSSRLLILTFVNIDLRLRSRASKGAGATGMVVEIFELYGMPADPTCHRTKPPVIGLLS